MGAYVRFALGSSALPSFVLIALLALPALPQGGPHIPQPPPRILVSTLFGGPMSERAQGVSVMQNGDILIAGETSSDFDAMAEFPNPPLGTNPDHTLNTVGNNHDAYVAILDPSMSQVKFWVYIGGNGEDRAYFAMQEPAVLGDNVWVVGFAGSCSASNCSCNGMLPTAVTQCYKNGGCAPCSGSDCWDVFVAKFSANLGILRAFTVVGGSENENPRGNLLVGSDGVYVSGYTRSGGAGGFYTTVIPPHGSTGCGNGGIEDAFLFKLRTTDGAMLWSTCYGGSGSDTLSRIRESMQTSSTLLAGRSRTISIFSLHRQSDPASVRETVTSPSSTEIRAHCWPHDISAALAGTGSRPMTV